MGIGSTVGKYIAIVVGVTFYFMALSMLLDIRYEKQEAQRLFNAIDHNHDGRLSKKEIESFEPCEDFEKEKFNYKLEGLGRRPNLKEFQSQVTPKNIKLYMSGCADGAKLFTYPEKISKLEAEDIQEDFFELYDLNGDSGVLWSEYTFVNSFNRKTSPRNREVFAFLDKLRDWRITQKEFSKAKLNRLSDTEGGNKPRRKRR